MSSKNVSFASNATSASSKDTKKKVATEQSLYDLWRPQPGIRYQLSQTAIDFNAVVPKVKLKYTRVAYDPGQDLSVPSEKEKPKHYAKSRGRKPVFKFQEEIDEKRRKIQQKIAAGQFIEDSKKRHRFCRLAVKTLSDEIRRAVGPKWFHELSVKQMQSADALKEAMAKDCRFNTIINTQETLGKLGLVLWPNHTKVEYCLKKFNQCPVEFLLSLVRLNRPKEIEKINEYTLNDRIMLSAVVHLSMREILRELHLRISCPPNIEEPPVTKIRRKRKKRKEEYIKWNKSMSPYLKPLIPVEQKHINEVYKNRHKEYASLVYFDYIDDMYNVYYVDDPESVKKRKQVQHRQKSKWTRPPKIPVRYIESKMKKKKILELKKPSPYLSPCKQLKSFEPKIEILPSPEEEVIDIDTNLCKCSPRTFNEDTVFDLKIKITTSEDELLLVQKLCPYNTKNTIGDLNLVQQTKIEKEDTIKCTKEETGKSIKKIEYSCICCTCGKFVNIIPDEDQTCPAAKITDIEEIVQDLNTIPEEDEEAFEDSEPEAKVSDVCKCVSKNSTSSSSTNIDDPYCLCTCKSSTSDSCTCCTCDQIDKDFLLKIKRYNEIHNTNHLPCLCMCQCKKHKKKKKQEKQKSDDNVCKYCFCTKKKAIVEEEEEAEEEKEAEKEEKLEDEKVEEKKIEEKKMEEKKVEEKVKEEKKVEEKVKEETKLQIIQVIKTPESLEDKRQSKTKYTGFRSKIEFFKSSAQTTQTGCSCEYLYTRFVNAHESCMSLFSDYKKKLEEDLEEYVQDMKNTQCLCGVSDNSSSQEMMEDEEYIHEDIPTTSSSEKCPKTCVNCRCGFQGCTCNEYGVDFSECICNTSESTESSESSGSSGSSNPCCCTCKEVPCMCATILEQVKAAKEAKIAKEKEKVDAEKKSFEEIEDKKVLDEGEGESIEGEGKIEETDPRIIVLDKFPRKRKEQMALLKKVLEELAADGYPLAKLPEVHRLPHFQIWLNMRSGKYISMEERDELLDKESKRFWNHLKHDQKTTNLPPSSFSPEKIHNLRWGAVNTYQKMITRVKADFHGRLKRSFIDKGQQFFPSVFLYLLPNKTFRECYFAYLPPDENHIFVFRPWLLNEHKDMSSRKSCL